MNKKAILAGTATLALCGLVLAPKVLAFRGDSSAQGPNCTPERHEAMTQAFNNKDYQVWKNLMEGKGRVSQIINEENFDKFVEMHQLRLEGKIDEVNQIRKELGLGMKNGIHKGQGQKLDMSAR